MKNPLLCIVVACLVALVPTAACAAEQPNVLFIAIDDLRTELGCYGVEHARSPNLDALARESVLFTHHYVQVATCGASRYALLTGRSPKSSGVTRSNAALYSGGSAIKPEQQPGAQTLPELFRRSGYHTTLIGKISHTGDGKVYAYNGSGDGREEMPGAWDDLATPYGPWKRGWGIFFAYAGGKHREDGGGNKQLMEFTVENDEDLPDGMMAAAAIEKLEALSKQKKPFFMGLGFFKPHLPFVAPKQDWEAMQKVDIAPAENPSKIDSPYWHGSGEFYKYNMPLTKTKPMSAEDQITARRAYLACVRYTDRQVGKVLEALDRLDLADNTVVVVWGDHGWHLGDYALWGKHSPFERANRSTLMIRAPGVAPRTCNAVVETIDLYPTLVDLCQPSFQKTVHPLDGLSLKPVMTGQQEALKPAAISYWGSAVSVRTPEFRMIGAPAEKGWKNVELYDFRESEFPVENVAAQHPKTVTELQRIYSER